MSAAGDGWLQEGVGAVGEGSAGGERENVERGPGGVAREDEDHCKEDNVDGEHHGDGAPVPDGWIDEDTEAEDEGHGSGDPRRRHGAWGGALAAARNQKCGDDERNAGKASAEELHR